MSVPDAAPLPRLGEVFFDVRGNSRSMRLSWYADTGVAVFSIWQAGMCTGTFRLPIADLGRMIELLQRGPTPRRRGSVPLASAERVDQGSDRPSGNYRAADDEADSRSGDDLADFVQGDFATDYGAVDYRAAPHYGGGAEQRTGYESADPQARDYGAPGYGVGDHPASDRRPGGYEAGGDYRADHVAEYQAGGYGVDERSGPGYRTEYVEHDYREYRESGDREHAHRDSGAVGYGSADPGPAGYPTAEQQAEYGRGDYSTDGGYRPPRYEPGDYWSRSPGGVEPGYGASDYSTGGFDQGRGADTDRDYRAGGVGYRDDRFVPPYVQGQEQSYLNDNLPPRSGHQGDTGDLAYPADRQPVSPSYGDPEPADQQDSYSYGSEYRYRSSADTDSDEGHSVGRSSGHRAG